MEETREETQPWRDVLSKIISDSQERQRIADALGIHQVTLQRWVNGTSTPRRERLHALLKIFPEYSQQLSPSLQEAFPGFTLQDTPDEALVPEIPPTFYARVFNTYITSPSAWRSSTICSLVLQQITTHLDPLQMGLVAVIAQCMPPKEDMKVRSLRATIGRGTSPWHCVETHTEFIGAESVIAHALRTGHLVSLQNHSDLEHWYAPPYQIAAESAVFCPLLQYDRVAGCRCRASSQPHHVSQIHLDLVQSYTDLLLLGFEPHEFYTFDDIALGIMPPFEMQQPLLASFQPRVIQHMLQGSQTLQLLTRSKAEEHVWREIEAELLRLSVEDASSRNNAPRSIRDFP